MAGKHQQLKEYRKALKDNNSVNVFVAIRYQGLLISRRGTYKQIIRQFNKKFTMYLLLYFV